MRTNLTAISENKKKKALRCTIKKRLGNNEVKGWIAKEKDFIELAIKAIASTLNFLLAVACHVKGVKQSILH